MPGIEHIGLYRVQVFGERGLQGSFLAAAHDGQQAQWIGEEWARRNVLACKRIKVTRNDYVAVIVS